MEIYEGLLMLQHRGQDSGALVLTAHGCCAAIWPRARRLQCMQCLEAAVIVRMRMGHLEGAVAAASHARWLARRRSPPANNAMCSRHGDHQLVQVPRVQS